MLNLLVSITAIFIDNQWIATVISTELPLLFNTTRTAWTLVGTHLWACLQAASVQEGGRLIVNDVFAATESLPELSQKVSDYFNVEADFLNDQQACWWGISELEDRGWDYNIYGRALRQVSVKFYRNGTSVVEDGETFMLAFCRAVASLVAVIDHFEE